jgi:flagellar basal body rod protein FlgC
MRYNRNILILDLERPSGCCFIIAHLADFHKPGYPYDDIMIRRSSMFDQSVAGIRANLEAFNQAAARVARPQAPTETRDDDSPKETTNDPGTRSKPSRDVDLVTETINMMVAQHGVEANLGVLKTALSLSGQTVDILA